MAYKITKAVNDMQNKHIKITIHAGAHKTATTHLQNRLLENENLLAKGGCSYLGTEKIREEFGTLWKALGRTEKNQQQKKTCGFGGWPTTTFDFGRKHHWPV